MKAELYFVRHGETEANRDGLLQGQCDYPLTEDGMTQADQVGRALSSINFAKLYASDLRRVVHTTEILLSKSSVHDVRDFQTSSLLREISFGVRERLPRETTVEEAKRIVSEREGIPIDQVVDSAESFEDLIARQKKFFVEVLHPELKSCSVDSGAPKILCVAHGGFIKRMLKYFTKKVVEGISNCSITILKIEWKDPSNPEDFVVTVEDDKINMISHICVRTTNNADLVSERSAGPIL
jgi:broad specificity phosphatase PhoE